jgi:hypothetical protein
MIKTESIPFINILSSIDLSQLLILFRFLEANNSSRSNQSLIINTCFILIGFENFINYSETDKIKRAFVLGYYQFKKGFYAFNTFQVSKVLKKSKSWVNQKLKQNGFSCFTCSEATQLLRDLFSGIKVGESFIRQWTIRKKDLPSVEGLPNPFTQFSDLFPEDEIVHLQAIEQIGRAKRKDRIVVNSRLPYDFDYPSITMKTVDKYPP